MKDRGSGTINVFIILMFLLLSMGGLSYYLGRADLFYVRAARDIDERSLLEESCREVFMEMVKDGTPGVDNGEDGYWSFVDSYGRDGITLGLADISSRPTKELCDSGILSALGAKEEDLTFYFWENETISGSSDNYPYVNDMPLFNLYYTDEEILELILSHEYKGEKIEDWSQKKDKILDRLEKGILNDKSLRTILDEDREREEYYMAFMGTVTWFWKISAESDDYSHTLIVCRLPREKDREKTLSSSPDYRVIESFSERKR